jgi:hypothetical protein
MKRRASRDLNSFVENALTGGTPPAGSRKRGRRMV